MLVDGVKVNLHALITDIGFRRRSRGVDNPTQVWQWSGKGTSIQSACQVLMCDGVRLREQSTFQESRFLPTSIFLHGKFDMVEFQMSACFKREFFVWQV